MSADLRPPAAVRADFDRIALATERARGADFEDDLYHDVLLRHVPRPCGAALEVGCGAGGVTRRLAERADSVLGVDLSPEMIRIARERSAGLGNVEFRVADWLAWEAPAEAFDCVASIATLHHLPVADAVRKMKRALRPGGTLLLLDLLHRPGVRGLPANVLAALVRRMRRVRRGRLLLPAELRAAWNAHGRGETYPRMAEVRALCAAELPGADVREHLVWRWSAVWRKPA
ncbi:MAG TPA: class I SAM-dependent methyltransferase [Longimicrobium sp.]|jgi:SAM-dependent methyltransferase